MQKKTLAWTLLGVSFLFLVAVGCGSSGGGGTTTPAPTFDYSMGANGPANWGTLSTDWVACTNTPTSRQSPIDIVMPMNDPMLMPLSLMYTNATLDLENTGHTIEQHWPNPAPVSKITWNGMDWTLLQFHFHTPTEHTIGGMAAAMEMHLVHKNAMGNLLVIGILFNNTGLDHPFLSSFDSMLPATAGAHTTNATIVDLAGFMASPLLVDTYYTYDGSLTTPPCSPIVTWIVLKTVLDSSPAQIAKFSTIMHMNARPVQPLNMRVIKEKM